jgi:hypothetical protein
VLGQTSFTYHPPTAVSKGAGGAGSGAGGAGSGSAAGETETLVLPEPMAIRAVCTIDAARHLVADSAGGLHLLVLRTEGAGAGSSAGAGAGASSSSSSSSSSSAAAAAAAAAGTVTSLELTRLGETVIASTLQYLDSGVVYVGSAFGDPVVLRLKQTKDVVTGHHFDVLPSPGPNLGPIVDFAVVDLERQGQGAIVTCSGVGKDGSLRVVRNGVGIAEQAVVDLPGIRGLWSLRPTTASPFDKFLVQSYSAETRVFSIEGDALEEAADFAGFRTDAPSLLCAVLAGNTLLQVTATEARLVKGDGSAVLDRWTPPGGARITVAGANATQVLVALSGAALVLLELDLSAAPGPPKLVKRTSRQMPHEVSCISLAPLTAAAEHGSGDGSSMAVTDDGAPAAAAAPLAAVGLWTDVTLRLLRLPDLSQASEEALGGDIPSRSVLLANLEGSAHAVVGMGDGHLFTFRVDPATGALGERRKVQLGRQPVLLSPFRNRGALHVFAACDRPTVLFSMSRKLLYSNVNLGDVGFMAPFNSESFPDCLALATPTTLTIGTVDEIQKLHVKTVPLGEQPRRIAHLKSARALVVATEGMRPTGGDGAAAAAAGAAMTDAPAAAAASAPRFVEAGALRLVDDTTYEPIPGSVFELDPHELCMAMASVRLGEGAGAASYVAVGTAYVLEDEEEPSRGRVLVLSVTGADASRRVRLVSQREVKGGVYAVAPLVGGKLVAAINSKVQVYRWGHAATKAAAVKGAGAGAGAGVGAAAAAAAAAEAMVDEDGTGAGAGSGGAGGGAGGTPPPGLEPECAYFGHTLALHLDTRGDFILVGDLMKSLSLLRYNPATGVLEEAASDPSALWTTAVGMLDDATFVGAERSYNLFTAARNVTAMTEEERLRLDVVGEFHTGEFINKLRPGSLVMLPQDAEGAGAAPGADGAAAAASSSSSGGSAAAAAAAPAEDAMEDEGEGAGGAGAGAGASSSSSSAASAGGGKKRGRDAASAASAAQLSAPRPRLVFATVSGAIGVLISLPPPLYRYLQRVQTALMRVVHPLGALSHARFRAFAREHAVPNLFPAAPEPGAKGFVDGDLLETFLDLERTAQEKVVAVLNGKGKGTGSGAGTAAAAAAAAQPLFPEKAPVKHPNGSSEGEATVEEVLKAIEDLARLH